MEGVPSTNEDGSDKPESSGKKKQKRAETLGAFVFEPTAESPVAHDDAETKQWFEKLFTGDDRSAEAKKLRAESDPAKAIRRVAAPEAKHLHGAAPPLEHIGKVIVGAETLKLTAATPRPEQRPAAERQVDKRRIQTMGHEELLAVSETIPVEHSNLRLIYETHLISEQGLRRLIEVQVKGGNLKKALRREIMEHDIDFERDPILRDRQPAPVTPRSVPEPPALDRLLTHAVNDNDEQQEATVLRAQIKYETARQIRHQQQQRTVDIGLAGVILLLATAVVILLLSR